MIDRKQEKLIRLSAAAASINTSAPPSFASVWRWATHGVGPKRTRLETVRIGGMRFTSEEAIQQFVAALNEPGTVPEPPKRAAERAGERLASKGA